MSSSSLGNEPGKDLLRSIRAWVGARARAIEAARPGPAPNITAIGVEPFIGGDRCM